MKSLFHRSILATAMLASTAAHAEEVVVTATRFAQTPARAAANVSVITREDILNSPATDLPALLNYSAGINVRTLYGSHGIDATADMRGFGENGTNNSLILLDGQRLNPVDGGSVMWSAVPLEAIERIEIIRGQGSVMFGDRASGGVITIITATPPTRAASIAATAGSFGKRALDATLAGSEGGRYGKLFIHHAQADGWRRNSQSDQDSLSGRIGAIDGRAHGFVDYAVYRDSTGLPGALFSQAYRNDPRSARFPLDNQRRDGYRLRPGLSVMLGETVSLEAEASVEQDRLDGDFVSAGMQSGRTRDTISFTPRLRWQHTALGLPSDSVFGFDFYQGDIAADYSTSAPQRARQDSQALYFNTTTELAAGWALNVGGRAQRVDQRASQAAYVDAFLGPVAALQGDSERLRRAFDLGLVYQGTRVRAYGKVGSTFRFASTDELFGYDPNTFLPVFAGDLRPQRGRLIETGFSMKQADVSLRSAAYLMRLHDEIGYDSSLFANVNLDPTRRVGLEVEVDWRVRGDLSVRASSTYTDARFDDGPNRDRIIPLVPRQKTSLQLEWRAQPNQRYQLVANRLSAQFGSGDFANTREQLPAYHTLDASARWDLRQVELMLRVNNLQDRRYAPYGGYSTFSGDYFYYPADARSVQLSARYMFK